MNNNEQQWDKLLRIKTSGRDDSKSDTYRYPYEPTPYCVLERLAASEYIGKKNVLLDYGCGKGRVDFFLSYQTRCKSVGIDYDERMYQAAMRNHSQAASANRTTFAQADAVQFVVEPMVDRFYFFNPFSVELLQSVMGKVIESYYENPRDMLLFFYYPSDEYVSYLMSVEGVSFYDEISCEDLFEGENARERILIFEVG